MLCHKMNTAYERDQSVNAKHFINKTNTSPAASVQRKQSSEEEGLPGGNPGTSDREATSR